MSQPLTYAKTNKYSSEQKKILVTNEVNQHASKGPSLFCFGEGGGVGGGGVLDFLDSHCFQCVPIKSHCVPIKFPKHVPQVLQYVPPTSSNNSSHYPISFDLSSILVIYIVSPKGGCVIYPFWDCPKLDYIFL